MSANFLFPPLKSTVSRRLVDIDGETIVIAAALGSLTSTWRLVVMIWLDRCAALQSRVSGIWRRFWLSEVCWSQSQGPTHARGGECVCMCVCVLQECEFSEPHSYQLLNHPSNYCCNWASISPSIIQGRQTEWQNAARDVTDECRDNKGRGGEGGREENRKWGEMRWEEWKLIEKSEQLIFISLFFWAVSENVAVVFIFLELIGRLFENKTKDLRLVFLSALLK